VSILKWSRKMARLPTRHVYLILVGVSLFSLGVYIITSHFYYQIGFPLDDAWIHQTYARNLVMYGEWSFVPGKPSAGSTGPLWSGILAFGFLFELSPYIWTFLLGWLFLSITAIIAYRGFSYLYPESPERALLSGCFIALEWHLVWAAGSGMETTVFSAITLAILVWLLGIWHRSEGHFQLKDKEPIRERMSTWVGLGALAGISVWFRPDGITLMGPIGLVVLLKKVEWKEKLRIAIILLVGFGSVFLPYLIFNRSFAGAWWPNTYYAKQAEYASLQELPYWLRLVTEFRLPLVGAGVILVPGFVYIVYKAIKKWNWGIISGAGWMIGYIAVYAWRLPATYQHGRYLIPMMPGFFLWCMAGFFYFVGDETKNTWRRVFSRTWWTAWLVTTFIFWVIGARAYAEDVAVIESEMVTTARWISANTEQEALVAAHDIGAIGYFSNRDLLDLAGLVSPQVIPFIRDENQLRRFLDEQGTNYLVTFPGWYPNLVSSASMIYSTGAVFSPELGGENMAVFQWAHGR